MIERDEVYRVRTTRRAGTLGRLLEAIGRHGAQVGEIETRKITHDYNIRDITVIAPSDDVIPHITESIRGVEGVELIADPVDRAFEHHRGGKLKVIPSVEVRTLQDMREIYTPGVARVSMAIHGDPSLARELTWKRRSVAVVSDGSRVLGLGNIGPEAALPVMEGKALFYAMFADLNAVPIVLATQDPDEIVTTVRTISPGFGGIHLEDIASPGVFDIEARLDAALDIPVMHDDQHGTAVVVLAAVLRAAELAGHDPADLTFAQVGLGAAGSAIALLATAFPFAQVHAYDPVPEAGARLPALAGETPLSVVAGGPEEMRRVMDAGDVLAMTTGQAQLMDPAWVRPGQIILALSNPVPEIDRRVALDAGAAVATDGSIVNNVLAYPGLFKGAMDSAATSITLRMKGAAARTLASLAPDGALLPDPLDRSVHDAVASAVAEAAREAGAP
jgi:malate dehydrogenase (oxaloacetate-decarboxylating)